MCSVHTVELHDHRQQYKKILSVPQQCFCGAFMTPAAMKCHLGLCVKCLILLSNFNQIWVFLTDFHEVPQNQTSSGRCADTGGDRNRQTDRLKDVHDEPNKLSSRLCKHT